MAISAAKLEANRRNAQKSTGPRTQVGKDRSKMNAVTHGCRAETLVLPEEDPQEFEARRAAWTASLGPRCELEQRAVDDAVVCSWRQDRARRAEAARADVRMADGGESERKAMLKEVDDLGRRLFKDRLGPVAFYPLVPDDPALMCTRSASTSYPPRQDNEDADRPAALVLELQSTLAGCEWMLGEWARLQSILDKRQPWISADKLKAVRLLGGQPFDAIDDGDVALVFLATHRLKPEQAEWAWEILSEMNSINQKRFRSNAADRELESLMPADARAAQDALGALIQRETERLNAKAETHRRRERVKAARAGDLLGFDETPDGERLRRFEITSSRGYARAIDTFLKLRRAEAIGHWSMGPLSGAPLPGGDDVAAAIANPNEPNEPVLASDVDISWALEYAPNEPSSDRWENVTSEPSAAEPEIDLSWALAIDTNKLHGIEARDTNEPATATEDTDDDDVQSHENLTNEPTDDSARFVSSGFPEDGCGDKCVREAKTNEPTDACENGTNDAICENATNEPGNCEIDRRAIPQPVVAEEAPESYEDAIKRIRRTREEEVREWNEQARKLAEAAMFAHRTQHLERENRHAKLATQTAERTSRSIPRTKTETHATRMSGLGEGVKTALGSRERGLPAPD